MPRIKYLASCNDYTLFCAVFIILDKKKNEILNYKLLVITIVWLFKLIKLI